MDLENVLGLVTQGFYLLMALLTLVNFARCRDEPRFDIALTFNSLGIVVLLQILANLTGTQANWISTLRSMLLIAQPYLFLRLVKHFRNVPRPIEWATIGGLTVSGLCLAVFPTPLPNIISLALVAYFVATEGYAVTAFVGEASRTGGVTRQQLTLISIGSGLLAFIILLAGIGIVLPDPIIVISPLIRMLAVLSGLSYFLGIAPPRWLRQFWQLAELRDFLMGSTTQPANHTPTDILTNLHQGAVRAVGGSGGLTALWDEQQGYLEVIDVPGQATVINPLSPDRGRCGQAWRDKTAAFARSSDELDKEERPLMTALNASALFIVPIATAERSHCLLLVGLRQGTLFADSDLALLRLFAGQAAAALDRARESERQLHRTLDNLLEGCQIIGFDWRYLYLNEAAARQGQTTKATLPG